MYPTPYDDPVCPQDVYPLDYAKKRYSRAIEPLLLKQDGRYEILEIKGGIGVQDIIVKVKSKRNVHDELPLAEIDEKDLRVRDIRYHRFTVQEVLNSKFPNGIVAIPANASAVYQTLIGKAVMAPQLENEVIIGENSFTINCTDPNSLFWTGSGTVSLNTNPDQGGGDNVWAELVNATEEEDGSVVPGDVANGPRPSISSFITTKSTTTGFRIDLSHYNLAPGAELGRLSYWFTHTFETPAAAWAWMSTLFSGAPSFTQVPTLQAFQAEVTEITYLDRCRFRVQTAVPGGAEYLHDFLTLTTTLGAVYVTIADGQIHTRVTVIDNGDEVTVVEATSAHPTPVTEFALSFASLNFGDGTYLTTYVTEL